MNRLQKVGSALVAGSAAVAGSAMAADPVDYSGVLTGLDSSTAITAIIGAGVIIAGVGFAKWATKKVARFFG